VSEGAQVTRIDARGLKCPWPAIRLARALRDGDGPVEIVADDPAAEREIRALALARGKSVEISVVDRVSTFRID